MPATSQVVVTKMPANAEYTGVPEILSYIANTTWSNRFTVFNAAANALATVAGSLRNTPQPQAPLVPSHFVWPELISLALKDLRHDQERQTILITYALDGMQQGGACSGTPE